jgi:hypothetical protein
VPFFRKRALIQYPKFVFEKKAPVPLFAGSPSDDLAVYSHRFFIPAALEAELTPGYNEQLNSRRGALATIIVH